MDTASIASQFVDLVLKYQRWEQVKKLPQDEGKILFATVEAAGFEPKDVVRGDLVGHYLDQDGSRTGKTYPINALCPFKVVSQEDDENYFATGWLDCALRMVISGVERRKESRDQLIEEISKEIERSVPLDPIQLTPEGDLLREYPRQPGVFGSKFFINHARDNNKLHCCVGVHKYCNGWMDRVRATKDKDAIVCRKCRLRVLFPKDVQTYGELRQALALKQVQAPT